MEAVAYPQGKTFEAAVQFARTEGKIPAPETGHAIRAVIDEALAAKETGEERVDPLQLLRPRLPRPLRLRRLPQRPPHRRLTIRLGVASLAADAERGDDAEGEDHDDHVGPAEEDVEHEVVGGVHEGERHRQRVRDQSGAPPSGDRPEEHEHRNGHAAWSDGSAPTGNA